MEKHSGRNVRNPHCGWSGGFRGEGRGGGSHLLTMPLWCLPTSVPDGDLVGMLKFNADESWLTSWEINVTHRPECWWRAGWRYLIFSFGGGGQLMYLCAENNSLVCKTWKIRFCSWNSAYIITDWSWLIGWSTPCRTLCRLISIYAPTPPSDEQHRIFIICKHFCFYFCFPVFCWVSLHIELQKSYLLWLSVVFSSGFYPQKETFI